VFVKRLTSLITVLLHCSALYLHQCLPARISLRFLFFYSVSECTPQLSLPLSDKNLCSISFFYALCSVYYFHSMRYASSVHFISCTQHASTRMNNSQQKQPSLLCSMHIYHAKSSSRAYTQLFILSRIILSLFFISGRYPEILRLLWQLQSSTHFHLSIV
jgi:hypothetical protein